MIRVAICDDSVPFTTEMEMRITRNATRRGVRIEVDVFFDGSYLTEMTREGARYDIIYLDIEMKKENGLDTGRHIREVDRNVQMIYVSGYESYAAQGYEVDAIRFLSKPIKEEKFQETFDHVLDIVMRPKDYFYFKVHKTEYKLPLENIMYFESHLRKVHIMTDTGEDYSFYGTLDQTEKIVAAKSRFFLRIQKSYLVNHRFIKRLKRTEATLYNEMSFSISPKREREISRQYLEIQTL